MRIGTIGLGLGVALVAASLLPAAAQQQPTRAQVSAIRESCRDDYKAFCASVPRGKAAMDCLRQNAANLSQGCQQALSALPATPAGRTTP
jgi:citrate synthase